MKRFSSTNSMNLKVVGITLVSYTIWLIFGLVLIELANSFSYGSIHVFPMVIQFVSLVFYILFVMARLYQQWRTRTVVKKDNYILLVGLILFCGTAFIFSIITLVPVAYLKVYQVIYVGGDWGSATMLILAIFALYRIKKTTSTDLPTMATQKLLKYTVVGFFIYLLLDLALISMGVGASYPDTNIALVLVLGMYGIFVAYAVTTYVMLRKQQRVGALNIRNVNIGVGGAFGFTISPLICQLFSGIFGYAAAWALLLSTTHISLLTGGVFLILGIFYYARKNMQRAGGIPKAVEAQPVVIKQQQAEEQLRQAEAKALKQTDTTKQKPKDTARTKEDDEKRRKAEEKAKRKAEDELRKKAEVDAKARRKAEQDAQKKAEYEAEIRRRTEAEARARADAEAKRRAEEDAKMKKLQQLVKVSDRLSVARMAQLLEMPAEEVWKHVPDWAEKFNFRIAGEELVFNKENVDAFVSSLDAEFRKWGKDGKV